MDENGNFKRKNILHFLDFEIYKLTYFKSPDHASVTALKLFHMRSWFP